VTKEELEREFLRLAETGEVDRILRGLRSRYWRIPRADVVDAYGDAVVEVVRRWKSGQTITNLPGLLTTVARRRLAVISRLAHEEEDIRTLLEIGAREPWEHNEERQTKIERGVLYIKALLPRLDNDNYRRTLVTILDAAKDGVQLENKELGSILGCAPNTAGMWRLRALQRLLPLLKETGIVSMEDLLEMLPVSDNDEDNEDEELEDE